MSLLGNNNNSSGFDKNSIIGMLLIGVIFVIFAPYMFNSKTLAPKTEETTAVTDSLASQNEANNAIDTIKAATADTGSSVTVSNASQARFGIMAVAAQGANNEIVIENKNVKVYLHSKGGSIAQVELKKYKTYDSNIVAIFKAGESEFNYTYKIQGREINTKDLYFKINSANNVATTQNKAGVSFKIDLGNGKSLEHNYTLAEDGWKVDHTVKIVDLLAEIDSKTVGLQWRMLTPRQEQSITDERMYSTVYYKNTEGKVDYISESKDAYEEPEIALKWVAMKQKFFNAFIIKANGFTDSKLGSFKFKDDTHVKNLSAELNFELDKNKEETIAFSFIFSPNDYSQLKSMDDDMDEIIPLGWGIFGWVNKFFIIPIFKFLSSFNMSYGIVILLLTIIVRIVILPFTYKSFLSTAKMRLLKPEMDEIKAKNPDDMQKQQMETMKLYNQTGVNPLGGCLPLLFQMPIIIAVFRFIPSALELRQKPFLWAQDLSTYDNIYSLPFNIPFYGNHVSLFCLLMTVSTVLQMKYNSEATGAPANDQMKMMQKMMYFMPIMFLFVLNSYSSGLTYYYFISNILGFAQMYLIKKFIDEQSIRAKIDANKIKNKETGGKSAFQKRLENMANANQKRK